MTGTRIKLLNKFAKIPTKATRLSAGYDLYAATDAETIVPAHSTVKIGTGVAMEIPIGTFGAIFARSGLATRVGLRPANCVGVIDPDYRGEIIVAVHNDTDFTQIVGKQDRIAQLILLPYFDTQFNVVDELVKTDRGEGGFGSTGK